MPKPSEDEVEIQGNVERVLSDPSRRYGPEKLDAISVLQQAIAGFRREIQRHRPPQGKRMSDWGRQAVTEAARKIVLYQEAMRRLEADGMRAERPWLEGEPPLLLIRFRALRAAAQAGLERTANRKLLFHHTVAVLNSPVYLRENPDAISQDWPRVPLPEHREALLASAKLGRQVAALLDTETPVTGVTAGKVVRELSAIAVPTITVGPMEFDFRVTAGWGHAGKEGVTMPGKGKLLARPYRPEEQPAEPLLKLLGKATHDIYLNDTAYWRNVPEKVWDYTIGGYQVLKKWLSYREHELLGRPLTTEEAREVTHTVRRLAALILLQPELDANYQRVKAASCPWTP